MYNFEAVRQHIESQLDPTGKNAIAYPFSFSSDTPNVRIAVVSSIPHEQILIDRYGLPALYRSWQSSELVTSPNPSPEQVATQFLAWLNNTPPEVITASLPKPVLPLERLAAND